jgi:hypothetical protein
MALDSVMTHLSLAEDQYLTTRGWTPTIQNDLRVWKKNGAIVSHTEALTFQKEKDSAECREMDKISADLLPAKYWKD